MQLSFDFDYRWPPNRNRRCEVCGKLVLIKSSPMQPESFSIAQLSLDLRSTRLNVISFQSRKTHIYLDYHVSDLLRDVPNIGFACRRLRKLGIVLIGDLVQCSRFSVSQIIPKVPGLLEAIEEELHAYGLSYSMQIVQWKRPHTLFQLGA